MFLNKQKKSIITTTRDILDSSNDLNLLNVIPVVARSFAGKDLVADKIKACFSSSGISVHQASISSVLKRVADTNKIAYTGKDGREVLRQISEILSNEFGDQVTAEILAQECEESILLVPGPRQVGQMKFWKENTTCHGIFLDSSEAVRLAIMGKRSEYATVSMNREERLVQLQRDDKAENGTSGVNNIPGCIEYCETTFYNHTVNDTSKLFLDISNFVQDYIH